MAKKLMTQGGYDKFSRKGKLLKESFLTSKIDAVELVLELRKLGYGLERAQQLKHQWQEEKYAAQK